MQPAHQEMSQADFARELGVSRAAVSQWKSKDILRDDAFTLPGKKGKVVFEIAVDQVRRNRHIGQSLGNGIATKTTADPVPVNIEPPFNSGSGQPPLPMESAGSNEPAALPNRPDTVEDQLKRAKLEEQLRRNRLQATDEALRQGMLMSTDDGREQMAQIAGMMLQIFEGALPDFASAMAERFSVPQRDVLHLLRSEFRKVRTAAAAKERARAKGLDQDATASIDAEA